MRKFRKNVLKLLGIACGAGLFCTVFAFENSIEPPSPPGRPTVIDIRATECTIRYDQPVGDGGSPITGYIIEYTKWWWANWKQRASTPELEYRMVGFEEGESVAFRVKATNKAGVSAPSIATDYITFMDPFGN